MTPAKKKIDPRLADICFYWVTFTDEQKDDIYNTAAKLHTFNESYEDIRAASRRGLCS